MSRLFSAKTKRNVLVPGWIATFGFAALSAPPLGVAASVSLFVLGVVVVPALLLIPVPRAGDSRSSRVHRYRLAV